MEQIICYRCGSVNDYRTVQSGPHIKAICNGCDRYIKFLKQTSTPADSGAIIKTNTMAQGYYGSICIEDLFGSKIQKASNGKSYVCIDDLKQEPIKEARNGKHYANIGVWVNDDIDQYGNIASISLSQTQQEREQGAKKVYIGNLRRSGAATTNGAAPAAQQPAAQAQPAAFEPPF
jgi:hypothetical protein